MKAIRLNRYGGIDALHYEEVPTPKPGTGEVLVKITASGVNFIDTYMRSGLYKSSLPFTIGQEAAGVVEDRAHDVTEVEVGDHVGYIGIVGSYADYAIVPASRIIKLPKEISDRTAAAVLTQGLTAHYLAYSTYPLESDDSALIHAAAGGTGQLLVQMAKHRGATVFGTVSTEAKAKLAIEAGADDVIIYTEQDFEEETKKLTGGKGVQVVYDSVGKTTFEKSLNCLAPRGMMVLFGQASGPVPPFDPQLLNKSGSIFLTRPSLVHYTLTREELLKRVEDVFELVISGQLKVRIDSTYPLKDAAKAHEILETRQSRGKILIIP